MKRLISFLGFHEYEKDFFNEYSKYIYFIILNIMLFTISINAHANLNENIFSFFVYISISLLIVFILKQLNIAKIPSVFITYTTMYLVFSLLMGFFSFDIIYLTIVLLFIYFSIKSYSIILPNNKNHLKIENWNFLFLNDFNNDMAFQKYDIPFKQNTNIKKRKIQKELEILKQYNDMISYKNKINNENFEKYKEINFDIPKSLILTIYKVILDYTNKGASSVKTEPITYKVIDDTENPKPKRGLYIFEVKFDRQNLKHIKNKDGKNLNIKHGIEEIKIICKQNKMDLKIVHGMNKNHYLIRIHFFLQHKDDEVISVIKKINEENKNFINEVDLTSSSGLTTDYQSTEYNEVDTFDKI